MEVTKNMKCWGGRLLQAVTALYFPVVNPVLQVDDHYFLRYYAAMNRVVQPVMNLAFLFLRPNNGKTIKETIFEIDGYSQTKYRRQFDKNERDKLDTNADSKNFDISLLYKLLQHICGLADTDDVRWRESGTLENYLKQLKDHRNFMAHEFISFTLNILQEKINNLQDLCTKALEEIGSKTGKNVDNEIKDIKKGFSEALQGHYDIWEPYRQALMEERKEHSSVLLKEGRKDITRISKNSNILNPFSWLLDSNYSHLDVENIFTELSIEGEEKIEMLHLLTSKLTSGELPDTVVISGSPGMGKTSLLRFIIHDWLLPMSKMLGMENVDLVLPVELNHVGGRSIRDLLTDQIFHAVSSHLHIDDIISALRSIAVVWLLDSYDEANVDASKVLSEIVKMFPNSRIILTTRIEFVSEIERYLSHMGRQYLSVELKGFTTSKVLECGKKIIDVSVTSDNKVKENLQENFTQFCLKRNSLKYDILKVPLYLTIIVVLWIDCPDKFSFAKTRSSLYKLLVDHIIQKLMSRDSYKKLDAKKSTIQKKLHMFLDHLGEVLWNKTSECYLKEYEVESLEKKCDELKLPFSDTMSAFFVCTEQVTSSEIKEKYSVIHQTMLEFLCARAFGNKMIKEKLDIMATAETFFVGKRDSLSLQDPDNPALADLNDMNGLKKKSPQYFFENYHNTHLVIASDDFFRKQNYCSICSSKREIVTQDYNFKKSADGFSYLKTNNFYCYIRDHITGSWAYFLVGYLNLKNELTETRCLELAFIFSKFYYIGLHYKSIVTAIREADNPMFNSKIETYLKNTTFAFTGDHFFKHAKELLNHVTPKSVFLHYCELPSFFGTFNSTQFLTDSINTFVKYPVHIHFDLRYFFYSSDQNLALTKSLLERLLHENSLSKLITVRCPVDDSILSLLKYADNLQELTVRFNGEDISRLAELIKNLSQLKVVRIAMDPSSYSHPHIRALFSKRSNHLKTCIVLKDSFQLEPRGIGVVIKKMCPNVTYVILEGKISTFDLNKILSYIYWVIVNAKNLTNLLVILNIEGRKHLFRERYKLNKLQSFIQMHTSQEINFQYVWGGTTWDLGSIPNIS